MHLDFYKHLDEDDPLTVKLSMRQIAESCCELNYGTHRLLSALVHALRDKRKRLHQEYPTSVSENSPLADGIEALLEREYFS